MILLAVVYMYKMFMLRTAFGDIPQTLDPSHVTSSLFDVTRDRDLFGQKTQTPAIVAVSQIREQEPFCRHVRLLVVVPKAVGGTR